MISPRLLIISVSVLFTACESADRQSGHAGEPGPESGVSLVVVSNYPLYFFASRIVNGINGAPEIVLPIIEGDPAFWIPDAEQIQLLQSADVIALNGAGAESWLNLMTVDRRRLLDTSAYIENQLIPLEDTVKHQHGPEGAHSHQDMASNTWLDPHLALAQAQVLTDALSKLAPTGESQFRDNMAKLEQELDDLDTRFARLFARLDGRPVLFSHPEYQYLQRRYAINGDSVHWEPDEEPATTAWIDLQQRLSSHPASIMLWEREPLGLTKERLAAAGIHSVVWHTAANRPDEGNFLSVMVANADRLASAL
jgi:zinc transport system substrate-binding protein